MATYTLSQIIDRCLIVPLSEIQIHKLQKACNDFADSAELDELQDCATKYLFNEGGETFIEKFESVYKDLIGEDLAVPKIVIRGLAGYVLYHALILNRTIKDSEFEDISLFLKNYVLRLKKEKVTMPVPELLNGIINYSDERRKILSKVEKPVVFHLYPKIFSSEQFNEVGIENNQDIFDEVKYLAQRDEQVLYRQLIVELNKTTKSKQFIAAFNTARIMATKPKWMYVDTNPIATLNNIFRKYTETLTLEAIKNNICNNDELSEFEVNSESSLILSYLYNKEDNGSIADIELTSFEFAVYVYYEFFHERLIEA